MVAQDVPTDDRETLTRKFMNELNPTTERLYSPGERPSTIVGSLKMLSHGHNFHRANVVVLMEPAMQYVQEQQAAKRVDRVSQTASRTTVLRLVTLESALEKMVIESQKAEADVNELALSYIGTVDDEAEQIGTE